MKLSVFKDNQFVEDFSLGKSGSQNQHYFLGRDSDCHIILNDQRISRHHAEITFNQGKWFIKKSSQFGLLTVNGAAYEIKELQVGDAISLPPFLLTLSDTQSAAAEIPKKAEVIQEMLTETYEGAREESEGVQEIEPSAPESVEDHFDFKPAEENIEESIEDDLLAGQQIENEFAAIDTGMDEDRTKITSGFAEYSLLLSGDHAPYDRYKLEDKETYIGRDPQKCQIILTDKEASGVHAVIRKEGAVCILEDLNSSNGTLLNGERVNKSVLVHHDVFSIGTTTFTVEVKSELLQNEEEGLLSIPSEAHPALSLNLEPGIQIKEEGPTKSKSLFSKDALKDPAKRKKILYLAIGLLALWVFLGDDAKKVPTSNDKKEVSHRLKPDEKKEENKNNKEGAETAETNKPQRVYTAEEKQFLEATYILAKELFSQGKYRESLFELEKIMALNAEFKTAKQLYELSKQGLAKLEELEQERKAKIEERIRQEKVKGLLVKAEDAVKDHQALIAESIFSQILQLDPENLEVSRLRMELDAWKKEQERIALEKAQQEAERKRQLAALSPGKTHFLKQEWYKAIIRLEDFLKTRGLDEDLIEEASKMLSQSKEELSALVDPLVGKAHSLKEGQDLKGAYETYAAILKLDLYHEESLNQMAEIREILDKRSRKIYREALVSESLSLFDDAKEKFEEVKQVSPSDSVYFHKAEEKLKTYDN